MTYRQCMLKAHEELGHSEEIICRCFDYADRQQPAGSEFSKIDVPEQFQEQLIAIMKYGLEHPDCTDTSDSLNEIILDIIGA